MVINKFKFETGLDLVVVHGRGLILHIMRQFLSKSSVGWTNLSVCRWCSLAKDFLDAVISIGNSFENLVWFSPWVT